MVCSHSHPSLLFIEGCHRGAWFGELQLCLAKSPLEANVGVTCRRGRSVGRPTGPVGRPWPCPVRLLLLLGHWCVGPCASGWWHESVYVTCGPSNPCNDCVATFDWTFLCSFDEKGMIAFHFQSKICTHKFLQGHVEFGDLLAIWM